MEFNARLELVSVRPQRGVAKIDNLVGGASCKCSAPAAVWGKPAQPWLIVGTVPFANECHCPYGTTETGSGATLACFERLCVFGGYAGTRVVQPTVVLIDASAAGAVWTATTNGSVVDVSIAPAYVPETYFVSASGCTTPGLCSGPGAEASLWTVSFSA